MSKISLLCASVGLMLSSCSTYSITMVHGDGLSAQAASDVKTPNSKVSTQICVPAPLIRCPKELYY